MACADPRVPEQCWLKWVESEGVLRERGAAPNVPWTSGLLAKDFPGSVPMPPSEALAAVRIVALHTPFGDLRIRLRPDWHAPSVEYVQRVALQDVCTAKCVFYRAEPGFLLQGALRAVVAPNKARRAFRGRRRRGAKTRRSGRAAASWRRATSRGRAAPPAPTSSS